MSWKAAGPTSEANSSMRRAVGPREPVRAGPPRAGGGGPAFKARDASSRVQKKR